MTSDNLTIPDAVPSRQPSLSELSGNRAVYANDYPDENSGEIFKSPPMARRPGQRSGATVWMNDGVAEVVENDSAYGGQPPHHARFTDDGQADAAPKADSSPPVFMREGTTQRILARDASMSDLVDLGGAIGVTSIGSALHNGWLTETANGFEKAGEALRPKPARKPVKATKADAEDADMADTAEDTTEANTKSTEPAPSRDYLAHHEEALLRDIEQHVGPETYAAVETFLTADQEIPDHVLSQVAATVEGDKAAAKQVIARAVQPFYQQAAAVVEKAVGPGMSEAVFEFARSNPKGQEMLRGAMKLQANERSTAGYTKLARSYLADLATKDPQAVADGINRSGTAKARVSGKEVIVDLGGKRGEVSFVAAMRSGII